MTTHGGPARTLDVRRLAKVSLVTVGVGVGAGLAGSAAVGRLIEHTRITGAY